MPPSDSAIQNSPLAPSVEKAYYRKCIELKRRLNEVEQANDEMKVKRVRLDRAIMKLRLERAFLLDQLAKRMEQNPEGSEGSADEGMATPPPDRPHRDKRRRAPTAQSSHAPPPLLSSQSSQHQRIQPAPPAHGRSSAQHQYGHEHDGPTQHAHPRARRGSSYDRGAPVGLPGATAHLNGSGSDGERAQDGGNREPGPTSRVTSATRADANGERSRLSEERATSRSASRDGAGDDEAYTSVNRG